MYFQANSRNYRGTHVRVEKVGGDVQWVGLDWVGVDCTGQINDPARSKNSSLALCPPFTQNRCHFGRGDSKPMLKLQLPSKMERWDQLQIFLELSS